MTGETTIRQLRVEKAQPNLNHARAAASYIDDAMSGSAALAYGKQHQAVLQRLFLRDDTLQSYNRTWFAYIDQLRAGQICCIPAREYVERRDATRTQLRREGAMPWLRSLALQMQRKFHQTPAGPWQPDQLYVESVAVSCAARRSGVGKALLAHAANSAATAGLTALAADVSAFNNASRMLVESMGFRIHRQRHNQLKLASILPIRAPRSD